MLKRWFLLTGCSLAMLSCGPGESSGDGPDSTETVDGIGVEVAIVDAAPPQKKNPCPEMIERVVADEELARQMSEYYEDVPQTILSAKIVPVVYLAVPAVTENPGALEIREKIASARRKEKAVRSVLKEHAGDRPLLREVFLREGYLFESNAHVAAAVVRNILFDDLFEEETIYLQRGGVVRALTLEGKEYADARGERVSFLLNDRVAATPGELEDPIHLDMDQVRGETGAQRTVPVAISADAVVASLVYPNGFRTRALLERSGTETRVVCTTADPWDEERARREAELFWSWSEDLMKAAMAMVLERPGFDEPVDEPEGDQEDGKLRIAWRKAYYRWQPKFNYREEEYRVYDRRGNPTPPQVCIDFIFDTWERSSGNWFRKRGSRPGRNSGFVDFKTIEGLSRRHTPSVLAFAQENPGIFERYDFPRKDQIPFRRRAGYAGAVARNADHLREGDLLVIHGLREEDMEEHFHTLLVLRTDPVSGMPMVVADNAGRPRIRNLASGMRSAPRRAMKYRIRVAWEWMEKSRMALEVHNNNINIGLQVGAGAGSGEKN